MKTTVLLRSINDYAAVNEVYAKCKCSLCVRYQKLIWPILSNFSYVIWKCFNQNIFLCILQYFSQFSEFFRIVGVHNWTHSALNAYLPHNLTSYILAFQYDIEWIFFCTVKSSYLKLKEYKEIEWNLLNFFFLPAGYLAFECTKWFEHGCVRKRPLCRGQRNRQTIDCKGRCPAEIDDR